MLKHTPEELKNDENARLNVILETLKEWSDFQGEMETDYIDHIAQYQKERREMLKYLGTIAGGAAALAPQLLGHVLQTHFFYTGIGLLCLVVIIAATHVLSTIENDITKLSSDIRGKNAVVYNIRKPKIDFLKNRDYSVTAFAKAMSEGGENVLKEDEKPKNENNWYKPMDYTGEFTILFTIAGLALLALGLTSFIISWKYIVIISIGAFVIINLISSFPDKIFMILGSPIDLIKSVPRWLKHKK